jgi:hypothetical protein
MTPDEAAPEFWYQWHMMIEHGCKGRDHLRYQIEGLDGLALAGVMERIGYRVSPHEIEHALSSVPRTTGARPEWKVERGHYKWDELPEHVQQLARKYGYTP